MPKAIREIIARKKSKQKIVMLTAYDYPLAKLLDESGVDIILVGDSVAHVVLGLESTREVGMTEMLHHAKAVRRAVKDAMLVGDMPFNSYQRNPKAAVENAKRFIEEAGCDAVKLEWFDQCLNVCGKIIKAKIPVMGHVGLTPQTADRLGGYKVQGRDADSAKDIIQHAQDLETQGCFSVVLECIPDQVAKLITRELSIPTIGIGAGADCDGQVLVTHDLLGLSDRFHPKFVKQYVRVNDQIMKGVGRFIKDVRGKKYPDEKHSYHISREEFQKLKAGRI